jgi:hypothetical protein
MSDSKSSDILSNGPVKDIFRPAICAKVGNANNNKACVGRDATTT